MVANVKNILTEYIVGLKNTYDFNKDEGLAPPHVAN